MSRAQTTRAGLSRQTGLTLIELVVALSLVALTGLILSSNVSFGSRVWETSQSAVSQARQRNAVTRRIVDLVSSARPPDAPSGGRRVMFTGDEEQLRFRAKPPIALARGESRDLILQFTRNKGLLVLTILPSGGLSSNSDPGKITPMLDNVEDFRIRYLGLDPNGVSRTWSNLWSGRTILPELVEFTLTRNGKTITFSAAPRLRGTVGCLLLDRQECDYAGVNNL